MRIKHFVVRIWTLAGQLWGSIGDEFLNQSERRAAPGRWWWCRELIKGHLGDDWRTGLNKWFCRAEILRSKRWRELSLGCRQGNCRRRGWHWSWIRSLELLLQLRCDSFISEENLCMCVSSRNAVWGELLLLLVILVIRIREEGLVRGGQGPWTRRRRRQCRHRGHRLCQRKWTSSWSILFVKIMGLAMHFWIFRSGSPICKSWKLA